MEIINKKPLSEIKEEQQEKKDMMLVDIYEILIDLDDRLTKIEEKLNGGVK
ncbi:hypothetical protein RBU61_08210 [Tissierella sp. MB52-C2]|uniref:hypothetical protein n=1 Tax=Tissierella sp. MB52-C2 TaxID=3070999 RepID=UPI00280A6E89|nr:hypothetical protein [Tissierella sp. MB52-C2]WMM26647.1 hypothetical protein RBU61_08210 [Tissierella sp. MB52-C2]